MGIVKTMLLECQGAVCEVLQERPHLAQAPDRLIETVGNQRLDNGLDATWAEVNTDLLPGVIRAAVEAELEPAHPMTQVAQALVGA
jgi:hypothetical protein